MLVKRPVAGIAATPTALDLQLDFLNLAGLLW